MTSTQRVIKYCALAFAFIIIFNIFYGIVYGISKLGNLLGNDKNNIKEEIKDINLNADSSVIDLDIKYANLVIKTGNELKVETNNKYIDVKQNNGKLIVSEKKHNPITSNNNNDLTLYVPNNMIFDTIIINAGAGNINAEELNTKKASLNILAGNVEIDKFIVYDEADIEGGVGKLNIKSGTINNLDLSLGVGETIITSDLLGKSDIEAGIGRLELNLLGDSNSYKIHVEKGIGSIRIDDNYLNNDDVYGKGNNEIEIDGGIGSVEVNLFYPLD